MGDPPPSIVWLPPKIIALLAYFAPGAAASTGLQVAASLREESPIISQNGGTPEPLSQGDILIERVRSNVCCRSLLRQHHGCTSRYAMGLRAGGGRRTNVAA